MQFARLNGVTLHHQVFGAAPDRPTIVFANSLGTDFRIWRDVIVRLAGDYGMITYDKRGHGLSEHGSSCTMDDHVGDLAAVIDHYGARHVIVCGLSVGGVIAQGLSAKRPELLRGLILCDTAHRIGTEEMWNARIAAVEANGIASISEAVLERWFTKKFRDPANPDYTGYRMMLERTPVKGYAATCAALRDTDFTEVAKAIKVPTICVVGEEDGSTPPSLVGELARIVPGSLYQPIPGAAHIPCVETPAELAEIIRAFIEGLPPL
jgi:3-oxoadipate enol-lactonase